jgi:hypothetical protein
MSRQRRSIFVPISPGSNWTDAWPVSSDIGPISHAHRRGHTKAGNESMILSKLPQGGWDRVAMASVADAKMAVPSGRRG